MASHLQDPCLTKVISSHSLGTFLDIDLEGVHGPGQYLMKFASNMANKKKKKPLVVVLFSLDELIRYNMICNSRLIV